MTTSTKTKAGTRQPRSGSIAPQRRRRVEQAAATPARHKEKGQADPVKKPEPTPNPLAQELVRRNCVVLGTIDLAGEKCFKDFSVLASTGRSTDWRNSDQPATAAECAEVVLEMYPICPTFKMQGSPRRVAQNAVAGIRQYAQKLIELAKVIERKLKSGALITSPVVGFCVVRDADGERLSEVLASFEEASDLICGRREVAPQFDHKNHGVHAVFKDGSTIEFYGNCHQFMRDGF